MNFLVVLNLTGSMIIFSSSSWFSIWMGMEISSMTAPSMITSIDSSLVSKINSWKYYMVQCFSSAVFFLSILSLSFSSPFSSSSNILWIALISSMLLKMGILPFHGWMFHLAFSLPWTLFLIFSTIQKIGPLLIISECSKMISQSMQSDLLMSILISLTCISGLKINSIRYFMVTSAIINSAWMMASAQVGKFSFISFMILYFIHLLILFSFLKIEFSNPLESFFFMMKKSFLLEMTKTCIILSMIGMPPLVGFFMKMSVIEQLILSNQIFTSIVLTMSSSILMLMYLKMIVNSVSSMRLERFSQLKMFFLLPLSPILLTTSFIYFFM